MLSHSNVSMHLLVLSAFRPRERSQATSGFFGVSMHLLVLSAFRRAQIRKVKQMASAVSMHLLVLSAFRLPMATMLRIRKAGLNAPSGAQCFPTYDGDLQLEQIGGLNAPSGAQCFPTVTG